MKRLIFTLAIVLNMTSASDAGIIDVTGDVKIGAAPNSVGLNGFDSDKNIRIFQEQASFLLSKSISVDITAPGNYLGPSGPGGSLAAGLYVNSYYVDFNPVNPPKDAKGTVTFDQDVLGIIINGTLLKASDLLGNVDTNYPGGAAFTGIRGLESLDMDRVRLSADRRTVRFDLTGFATTGDADQIRIITAIPEPGSLALFGMTGGAIYAWIHFRRSGIKV